MSVDPPFLQPLIAWAVLVGTRSGEEEQALSESRRVLLSQRYALVRRLIALKEDNAVRRCGRSKDIRFGCTDPQKRTPVILCYLNGHNDLLHELLWESIAKVEFTAVSGSNGSLHVACSPVRSAFVLERPTSQGGP